MNKYLEHLELQQLDAPELQSILDAVGDGPPAVRGVASQLATATWAAKVAWSAIPEVGKDKIREVFGDLLSNIQGLNFDVGAGVGGGAGMILDAAKFLMDVTIMVVKGMGEAYADMSDFDRAEQSLITTQKTLGAFGVVEISRYVRFYPVSVRINSKPFRYEPAIRPEGASVVHVSGQWNPGPSGYNANNSPPGIPGVPFRVDGKASGRTATQRYQAGDDGVGPEKGMGGQNPQTWTSVNSLFWPWWQVAGGAKPIPIYATEGRTPFDPNLSMIVRQNALTTDWRKNLVQRGDAVTRMAEKLDAWEKSRPGLATINGGGTGSKLVIDSAYRSEMAEKVIVTKEYRAYRDGQIVRAYEGSGADLAMFGWKVSGDAGYGAHVMISIQQLNLARAMMGAFWRCRLASMNPLVAREILGSPKQGTPSIDRVDVAARDTLRQLADEPDSAAGFPWTGRILFSKAKGR